MQTVLKDKRTSQMKTKREKKHNNKYKLSQVDRKNYIPFIAGVVFLLVLFYYTYTHVIYDISDMPTKSVGMEDILYTNSYDVVGNTFVMTGEDPYFAVECGNADVRKVILYFQEPVQSDLQFALYYANKPENFSENGKLQYTIKEGKNWIDLELPASAIKALRFDIDGNFVFDRIECYTLTISFAKCFIYIIIFVLLLLLDWKYAEKIWSFYNIKIEDIYKKGIEHNVTIQRVFVLLVLILGIGYSFLIPIGQVPDEETHYNYALSSIGLTDLTKDVEVLFTNTEVREMHWNTANKMNVQLLRENKDVKFNLEDVHLHAPSIKVIAYFPSVMGLLLGIILNLPILYCMQLSELFSLLFYTIMGYHILKIIPVKKELMLLILLFPMTVQMCASNNYDAVLLPVCLYLVAYILGFVYGNKKLGWKQLLVIIMLSLCILIIKSPYLLLNILIILIPDSNWNLMLKKINIYEMVKKNIIPIMGICVIILCIGMYALKDKVSYVKLLVACTKHFDVYVEIVLRTIRDYFSFYVKTAIGVLGWLDTQLPMYVYIVTILAMLALAQCSGDNEVKICNKQKITYLGICILVAIVVIYVMITWSFALNNFDFSSGVAAYCDELLNTTYSLGVQGRYFIPILYPLGLVLANITKMRKPHGLSAIAIYYVVVVIGTYSALINRYW